MGARSMPWRQAMESLLADGEVHELEDVLKVGAAEVPQERALQEMGSKQSGQTETKRVETGQRNVAMQGVTGMIRFGQAKYVNGRKQIQWIGKDSTSIGDLRTRIEALEEKVEKLLDLADSQQKELDRLEAAGEESVMTESSPAEGFLAAAGVSAS